MELLDGQGETQRNKKIYTKPIILLKMLSQIYLQKNRLSMLRAGKIISLSRWFLNIEIDINDILGQETLKKVLKS